MTEQTEVLRYIVGPVCTNCYLLVNHKTGALLVVAPGDQAQLIEKQIEKTGAKPVAILLTMQEQQKRLQINTRFPFMPMRQRGRPWKPRDLTFAG